MSPPKEYTNTFEQYHSFRRVIRQLRNDVSHPPPPSLSLSEHSISILEQEKRTRPSNSRSNIDLPSPPSPILPQFILQLVTASCKLSRESDRRFEPKENTLRDFAQSRFPLSGMRRTRYDQFHHQPQTGIAISKRFPLNVRPCPSIVRANRREKEKREALNL